MLVAEDGGAVIGFCVGGRSREPDERFRGEVYAIYVLPEHHGRGADRALLQAAAKELSSAVSRCFYCGVRAAHTPSSRRRRSRAV